MKSGRLPITKLRFTTAVLLCFAVVCGLTWFVVPLPDQLASTVLYSPLGAPLSLFDAAVSLSGAVLFFQALSGFKPELKPAYRFIAFSQLTVGLVALLFPYIEYYNLWTDPTLNVLTYMGYFVGSILMFLGARKFYRTLGLTSVWARVWVVLGVTLLAWAIHAVLPHGDLGAEQGIDETTYDIFELIPTLPLLFYGAALYLFWQMKSKTGSSYRKVFMWLTIGVGLQFAAALNTAVLELVGYHNWYFASRLYIIPAILADIGLLCAAYQFNAMGIGVGKSWLSRSLTKNPEAVTSPDIIVYLASSVADASQIAPSLDKMRGITARQKPGSPLSAQDEQELLKVYLDIEDLLLHKDKLRAFDRADLRRDISSHFNLDSEGSKTFWPLLAAKAS